MLGYEAPKNAIPTHVDEDDRVLVNAETQHRFSAEFDYKALGQRGGWLINESGLYSLILSSKLPGAKKFKGGDSPLLGKEGIVLSAPDRTNRSP